MCANLTRQSACSSQSALPAGPIPKRRHRHASWSRHEIQPAITRAPEPGLRVR
jgi:hypothetical protein